MSDLKTDSDPRGPERTIVSVDPEWPSNRVTLDCGHVRELNPAYTYRVGDKVRCFACRPVQTGNR